MKKRAIRLLSMLLALLMLTGCSSSILNDPLDRAYRALQRSFISAGRNLVPFDEMEYLRPDMSTISADFDAVNDALESGDIDSVSAALDACYLDYIILTPCTRSRISARARMCTTAITPTR